MDEEQETALENKIDDDPVVKEIPIFLSKRLENSLYVFQYPLQPKNRGFNQSISKAYIRPDNQEVKLDVDLNVESINFDVGKAELIARDLELNSDKKKPENVVFQNHIMDKVLFTSNKAVNESDNYAIGCFNGRELHLTPIKTYLQLRPFLHHLDKSGKKKKETVNESDEEEESSGSSAKQVTVKFGKVNEKKKEEVNEQDKKLEAWIECNWHGENSTLSDIQKSKLYAENTEDHNQAKVLTPSEYIRVLIPEDIKEATETPSLPSNVMSLHMLRALPLPEQCRLLLKDAKIIQFQQLLLLLAGGEGLTPELVLKSLPQVAVLVRGNWVVKSEVLYPQNTFSSTSGVPADVMCRARDYILYLFTQNECVERKKVSSLVKIPAEELKEIFIGVSKLKHNKVWELSLATDAEFILKHSDVVQRQNAQWEHRAKQLGEYLNKDSNKEKKQRRKSKSVSEEQHRGKREHTESESDSEKNKSPIAARRNKIVKANNEIGVI
ncbi:DNA-directed RNA polymerase III subunit RPC5 [Onthophagus taurus]|uniref:DNA-directed RNA polymerase III subunit RPC5 n=1 Tax=Onthophagus taurus TaxID=166361 RepID=UPI000C20121E|nr:DNA-directed RNA polymerase III subunit RPC5 [Onthophagus taurus]